MHRHCLLGVASSIALAMSHSTRLNFTLNAPSKALDRRVHAARGDLADIALAGRIFVPHYATPILRTVAAARAGVHDKPNSGATMVSELVAGEGFAVLDVAGAWAWGFCQHDHYVGYVPTAALDDALPTAAPAVHDADWVAAAEAFLHVPYVWGGRSRSGIDCSGLLQVALAHAGIAAPRDADQQMAALGTPLVDDAPLQRGDLIFFPGHVGIMSDAARLLHATGHHGRVEVEPLADVVARFSEKQLPAVLARKRLV